MFLSRVVALCLQSLCAYFKSYDVYVSDARLDTDYSQWRDAVRGGRVLIASTLNPSIQDTSRKCRIKRYAISYEHLLISEHIISVLRDSFYLQKVHRVLGVVRPKDADMNLLSRSCSFVCNEHRDRVRDIRMINNHCLITCIINNLTVS